MNVDSKDPPTTQTSNNTLDIAFCTPQIDNINWYKYDKYYNILENNIFLNNMIC